MIRSLPVFVAALLFPLAAAAQTQPSSEDIELARALSQKGWFDLAEEVCNQIQKAGNAANKVMVPYVLAEIQLNKADRETDFTKSEAGLAEAVANFRKFLEANPTHPLAQEARVSVGWVSARKGRLLVDQLGTETTPDKHAELQKKAHASYGEAQTFYKQTIAELKAAKQQTNQIQDSLMDARLELPRVMVEHAKVPGVDEGQRKQLLRDALALFVDFEFDYGDRPIAFEAMLEEGKCLTELADYKQAESRLKATTSLRQRLSEAKIKPNEYHNKIIYGAYVALAQMFIKANKYAEARAFVDQVFKDDRSIEREWAGPALKLEKADALFRMKDTVGATAIANEIIKAEKEGKWAYFARMKIQSWSATGSVRMSPEQLMAAADASLGRDNFREALINLRKCIENCQTDAEKQKFGADAYYKMGVCYQDMKRNFEAVVAFESMFTLFPNHPSAAKACYECVRCYIAEFGITGDKREDEMKDKYLGILAQKWPKDPAARNIKFVQAEKVEKAGDLKKAAELYMQVGDDAEAYESALVAAGYCLHVDGAKKWEKAAKDPALQAEVKAEFRQAEDSLRKFLKRLADPSTQPPQEALQKSRASLALVANQELAYILMHDAVGKIDESLKFLELVAKDIPPDDDRIAKIWGTQIQAYLAQKQVDQAVKILDLMFQRFPDSAAIARSCKSVAIKLDEATAELTKNKGDQAQINENLKKISKYYAKWLQLAPSLNMRITMQDVVSVAETLYMIAKQMNGLGEDVVCFMELKGKTITEPQYWTDAAYVLSLVADGKLGKISARDQIKLMTRLARCHSFTASDAAGWDKAKDAYEAIIKTFKVIDARGQLDGAVLQANPELLGIYLEQGYVYYELGKKGNKFQFDNASTVFGFAQRMVPPGSATAWQCKYMVIEVLFERGKEKDVQDAKTLLDNLERNNPDFDAGKFGMKDKFLELKKKLGQVGGK